MTEAALSTKLPLIESPAQGPNSGLSGPSYSISGHAEKFKLPSTKVLKPGVEHHPGRLDSWPVHALNPAHSNLSMGRNSSVYSSHPYNSTVTNTVIKPSFQPKPKFLEELESYLSKELRLLGCPPSGPHELRLQAYREVFEYLIEDFKTYKGLLSAIKNEYELYMDYQSEVIKELKPMRTMLDTMREECERKILEMKGEEKRDEAEVRQENKRLMAVIDRMNSEEESYKSQINKLQEEVAELYKNYRLESDARKILVSEYNDVKFRQQEQKTEDDGRADEGEDPVVLKLKLVRAREDLRTCNQRINTMLADYGDVVPRREFEIMETSWRSLESETEKLKTDHSALIEEHRALQDLYKGIVSQRDSLSSELSDLKRSATPRPDWKRCGLYIEGGHDRWSELSEGRSSDGMLNILLAQMAGMDESEVAKGDPFIGEGVGSGVPRYLRTEGMVKNRKISLKEINELINGFWHHRLQSSVQDSFPLDEDLYYFLLARNENNEEIAVEDGYNIRDACPRLGHKAHVALFSQVIEGKVEENLFHYWLHLQTSLTEEFSKQQVGHGVIKANMLPKILETTLSGKSAENIEVLCDAALKLATVPPDSVGFVNLFTPDDSGSPSEFSMLLLEQYQTECKEFVYELAQEIQGQDTISLSQVQTILHKMVRESKNYEDQLLLLARAFSVSLEVISEDKSGLRDITTQTTQLLDRLRKLGVCKSNL